MVIRITKGKDDKPGTLTCVRDDGSTTWQKSSDYFARHDLMHYAVETILGYRQAFLGHVASGKGLDDYGTKNGVKDTYTVEEGWAEQLVGMLQWPVVGGGEEPTAEEIIAQTTAQCVNTRQPAPAITPEQIAQIRARIAELHSQWDRLPAGDTLELTF